MHAMVLHEQRAGIYHGLQAACSMQQKLAAAAMSSTHAADRCLGYMIMTCTHNSSKQH
jgi:hypothetical protein